ncbi:MAG: SAM-dependent methyltransferase [Bacteroidetes bacterium]|nr:MAG: SAM-dependent methyltransferase [Bacteroidota bacterium]
MLDANTHRFLDLLQQACAAGHFLKCTLGKPTPQAPEGLKNIYLRPVTLKAGPRIAFTYRYQTRDEVKNHTLDEAVDLLRNLLGGPFRQANLLTTRQDAELAFSKKGKTTFATRKPSQTQPADTSHDRQKQRLLDPAAPWLHALGITNKEGQVLPSAQDKWKQINKYLEIIESLLRTHPLPKDAVIADMGSGKGYLTFALYDFLVNQLGLQPRITGIELRQNLVDFCNKTAKATGFTGLQFAAQDINHFKTERLDLLIALHACDIATDLALAKGIHAHAGIVVVAPCCHKQVRRDMDTHNELAPILRHGILEERQAEIVTDGIRALLLEANGYKTNVFEFISTEHTAKNLMITAINSGPAKATRRQEALEKVDALKTGFGVKEHYLERLLAGKDDPEN